MKHLLFKIDHVYGNVRLVVNRWTKSKHEVFNFINSVIQYTCLCVTRQLYLVLINLTSPLLCVSSKLLRTNTILFFEVSRKVRKSCIT